MDFIKTPFAGLFLIQAKPIKDDRGLFGRTFCKKEFAEINFTKDFVQFNHSLTLKKGTVRGLHFQLPPYSETKLIRCVQGKIYDTAVDLRKNSPTFLQHFDTELSAESMMSILIPEGFAHGYQTLEDNSAFIYHHTQFYTPGSESGIRYDDPLLKIKWPLPIVNVSEKDKSQNLLETNFKGIEL